MAKKEKKRGRPLKFKTVEELEKAINAYFNVCDVHTVPGVDKSGNPIRVPSPRPYTITGLAVHLDTSRETLLDYEGKKDFSDTITRAKEKIHNYAEESLWTPKIATGIVFNLKNNWGWKDKTETDLTSGGEKLEFGHLSDEKLDQVIESKLAKIKID